MHRPLSLDDNISIEESRNLVEGAISQHPASILASKSQRNDLAPISRLPPEILCRIFFLVKIKVQERGNMPVSFNWRWVEITHVCSDWRRIALNWPNFWVDPPLGNLRWVEEMLERSKDAGLDIRAELSQSTSGATAPGLRLVLNHSSRIQRLSVDIYDVSIWDAVQEALPKNAPRLEYLSIMDMLVGVDDPSRHFASISEAVFCGTERLHHLSLFKCNPNWNSHRTLLRSLTHLTLYRLPLNARPTGRQFVDALIGMPDLEFLFVTESLPVEQTWDYCQIHFPHLQDLFICSAYMEVEMFFRCVTFPPTAKVGVECTVDEAFPTDLSHLNFSGVIAYLSRSYSKTISDMAFRTIIYHTNAIESDYGIRIKLSTAVLMEKQIIGFTMPVGGDLNLMFNFTEALPEQYSAMLMSNILNGALPLQDVIIHVDMSSVGWVGHRLSAQTIANTLGTLPQVRSVIVRRQAGGLFLELLQLGPYLEEAGSTGLEKLYFPNLCSVYFGGVKFSKLDLSDVMEDSTTVSVKSLRDCLLQRAESGAKIKKLFLHYCRRLEERDVDLLSGVVDEIDWDQHEDSESEYFTSTEEEGSD